MKRKNKEHVKRVRRLIIGCSLCAIILTVSTYAWFIGMKTVNVSSFDVSIAAIDSLSLSLDGATFNDTVAINKTNYNTASYEGNTNSWESLIPMSTVGVIDSTTSRMVMYEKGSLTTTPGGYRLMASKVINTDAGNSEQKGYVAFDLFVKNLSGDEYYADLNEKNEEAIYLTTDSKVTVSSDGAANTGIENSVRVAFAQIGRVKATTDTASKITGITCADVTESEKKVVTGICTRDAVIWEPNDTAHVENAINWYNKSCALRTGSDVTKDASYNGSFGTCNKIYNGIAYPTYAVNSVIGYEDNVDVYDGYYNTYGKSAKLTPFDYFTDTEKNMTGTDRPTFITLAPNSITKVRVYIYIEGQDVDNYDFASLGKQISVAFGLTKERYFDTDITYDASGVGTALPTDVQRTAHPLTTAIPTPASTETPLTIVTPTPGA